MQHTLRHSLQLGSALVALLLPLSALATPPENVHDIEAHVTPAGIVVQWAAVSGDIAQYHVFYSHESILDNNAVYDNDMTTQGNETTLTIPRPTGVNDLYVTVLAVNTAGEESPQFDEESHVPLALQNAVSSAPQAASSASSVSSTTVSPSSLLRALRVQSVSATGVLLTFSAPVILDAQSIRTAFTIQDGSGSALQIYRIIASGTGVLLDTLPQEQQRSYRVHIDPSLHAQATDGSSVLTLDPDQTDLLFLGNMNGTAPVAPILSSSSTASAADVQNLHVQTSYEGNDRYTIQVQWTAPTSAVSGYRVSQSADGGTTYSTPQVLASTVNAVRIPGVKSGEIGILVQAIGTDQTVSRGVFQRIILPAAQAGSVTGSVATQNGHLPQTGAGSAAILAIAGACAGAQVQRRRAARA